MENQSLAVVKAEPLPLGAMVVATEDRFAAIEKAGAWIAKSMMFGTDRVEQGAVIALKCVEEGLTLTEYERTYDLVKGKTRKRAMAAQAEFEARGGKIEWKELGLDLKRASARFSFNGQSIDYAYSIEDAQRAGLVKPDGGWVKDPANMLRKRLLSNAIGVLAPSIFAGCYPEDDNEMPAAALTLAPEVTTAAPPQEKPAQAVVVEATVVDPAKPEPADDVPMNFPRSEAVTPADMLPNSLQAELIQAIGGPGRVANTAAYLWSIGWLPQGHGMEELPEGRARQIIKKQEGIKAAVDKFVAGGGK